jgi:signal transduction histidine kinase
MPADKLDSLFRIDLNQSTIGTENESGMGLGLIISNEFVRLHHSELEIQSELDKGSSFSFELPLV